jgi:hypothetical protein
VVEAEKRLGGMQRQVIWITGADVVDAIRVAVLRTAG